MSAEVVSRATPAAVPLAALLGEDWDRAVRAADGTAIAELRPIVPEAAAPLDETSPLIETLCAWRNDNADRFLDPSRVTLQSTRQWLLALTGSPDRLLFVVHNADSRPVAQYGLRRLSADVVELDNGILGVRGEHPDLFYRIQLRILGLCRDRLGFAEARARVLADNIPALFLHKRCGLKRLEALNIQGPNGRDVVLLGVRLTDVNTD
ncbi:MAG: hypothetical protein DPW12_09605 [Rhodocyclaceae bacterium]|nr:hypothetical protein [Zoogloeaceae bacterium]MCG3168440.1 hypothetical protein [Bacteroidia bacterium]MCQ3924439.1 hypothetical protein [Rhodocyclaceae bacterium]HNQ56247.1 hypothetical protein [Candidatus Desulfobacillus denitrificans]HNT61498.1 hypothetical protein [Candidatus Desulfobacillus denitrificans]